MTPLLPSRSRRKWDLRRSLYPTVRAISEEKEVSTGHHNGQLFRRCGIKFGTRVVFMNATYDRGDNDVNKVVLLMVRRRAVQGHCKSALPWSATTLTFHQRLLSFHHS